MAAVKKLFNGLRAIHSYPVGIAASDDTFTLVDFSYIARLDPIRLVFSARTQGGAQIIIKFGYGKYAYTAHEAAAKSGLAPALLSYLLLAGRRWMVVMEPLEAGFKPCDELTGLTDQYTVAVAAAVRTFRELDLVHGDLRASSVFVKSEK